MSGGTNIVLLDPEIAAAFPTSEAVNEALRGQLKTARIVVRASSGATTNGGKKKVESRNRGRTRSK
jgi:hypothetical protein